MSDMMDFDDLVKLSDCRVGHGYTKNLSGTCITGSLGRYGDAIKPAKVYLCNGCKSKLRRMNDPAIDEALQRLAEAKELLILNAKLAKEKALQALLPDDNGEEK